MLVCEPLVREFPICMKEHGQTMPKFQDSTQSRTAQNSTLQQQNHHLSPTCKGLDGKARSLVLDSKSLGTRVFIEHCWLPGEGLPSYSRRNIHVSGLWTICFVHYPSLGLPYSLLTRRASRPSSPGLNLRMADIAGIVKIMEWMAIPEGAAKKKGFYHMRVPVYHEAITIPPEERGAADHCSNGHL